MKILVAFYSQTGNTKKVAQALAAKLGADIEEIKTVPGRGGIKGFIFGTKIEKTNFNPANYDVVAIGTPVWAHNITPAVRIYLAEHKNEFKKAAFFCTMGGSGDKSVFSKMEKIIAKKPVGVMAVLAKEASSNFSEKIEKFSSEIKQ